jgi:isocitrate dehydrogenase
MLVRFPHDFDVIVTTNMNGDILSDLTSGLVGGLGFAPSANIGHDAAIFEAVHGSAPRIAGTNTANPTALLFTATMLLRHLGAFDAARSIEHAVLATLESGVHTRDVLGGEGAVTTTAYTDAVIRNLGKRSERWQVREHRPITLPEMSRDPDVVRASRRRVAGVDVFVESALSPEELGKSAASLVEGTSLRLEMVASRGTMVYPTTSTITDTVDASYCRFMVREEGAHLTDEQLLELLTRMSADLTWTHVEKLNSFDGVEGWTKAQGQD